MGDIHGSIVKNIGPIIIIQIFKQYYNYMINKTMASEYRLSSLMFNLYLIESMLSEDSLEFIFKNIGPIIIIQIFKH